VDGGGVHMILIGCCVWARLDGFWVGMLGE